MCFRLKNLQNPKVEAAVASGLVRGTPSIVNVIIRLRDLVFIIWMKVLQIFFFEKKFLQNISYNIDKYRQSLLTLSPTLTAQHSLTQIINFHQSAIVLCNSQIESE